VDWLQTIKPIVMYLVTGAFSSDALKIVNSEPDLVKKSVI